MDFDFKVGDTVSWSTHRIGEDAYEIEAGTGVVLSVSVADTDGRNYAVLENGTGDEVWPLNTAMTKEMGSQSIKTNLLSGADIGKRLRIPMSGGLVIEGTLYKVSHYKDVAITIGFDESDRTWIATQDGVSEYVNV